MNGLRHCSRWVVGALALGVLPRPAPGEVLSLDAVLNARTQQLVNGEPGSFDEVFEDFGLTSPSLPLQVVSNLEEPTETGELIAAGGGIADVDDADLTSNDNPEELGLEANAFSIDPETAYQVTASAVETRTIRFTPGELGSGPGEEREIESSVFLSGAVFVWSRDPGRDLTGLGAGVSFTVDRVPDGETEGVNVFQASLGVRGLPDGEVESVNAGVGAFEFGGPEAILDSDQPDQQLQEYLDTLGSTFILLIPDQELRYSYRAEAGETFDLVATFEVDLTNLPDGTGVSAVFGREFEALAAMIDKAFGDVDGAAVEAGVNRAQALSLATGESGTQRNPPGGLCGSMGLGATGTLWLFMISLAGARRRRPPDPPTPSACGTTRGWTPPGGRHRRIPERALQFA